MTRATFGIFLPKLSSFIDWCCTQVSYTGSWEPLVCCRCEIFDMVICFYLKLIIKINRLYICWDLTLILILICPSLDGTYYCILFSICPTSVYTCPVLTVLCIDWFSSVFGSPNWAFLRKMCLASMCPSHFHFFFRTTAYQVTKPTTNVPLGVLKNCISLKRLEILDGC